MSDSTNSRFDKLKSILSPVELGLVSILTDTFKDNSIDLSFSYFDGDVVSKYIKSNSAQIISNKIFSDPFSMMGLYQKSGPMRLDSNVSYNNPSNHRVRSFNSETNEMGTKKAIKVELDYDVHLLASTRKICELVEFIYYTSIFTRKRMNIVMRLNGLEIPLEYQLQFDQLSSSLMDSGTNTNVYDISFTVKIIGIVLDPYTFIEYIDPDKYKTFNWAIELNTVGFDRNNDTVEMDVEYPDSLDFQHLSLTKYDTEVEYTDLNGIKENINGNVITRIYDNRVEVLDRDNETLSIYYNNNTKVVYKSTKSTTYKSDSVMTIDENKTVYYEDYTKKYVKYSNGKYVEMIKGSDEIVVSKNGFKFHHKSDSSIYVTNKNGSKWTVEPNSKKFRLRLEDRNLHDHEIPGYHTKYGMNIELWMTDSSMQINKDTSVLVFKS